MDKEVNNDNIGYAEDVKKPLDLSILDNDDNVTKYMYSLLYNSDVMFTAIKSGIYSKVLVVNSEKVYEYNKEFDVFVKSDLQPNSEEDYIVLDLIDIIDDTVPLFKINATTIEFGTLKYIWSHFVTIPFYNRLFKWQSRNAD